MKNFNGEKALQTYAYLTAYLRTDSSVSDVYDCLIPFLRDSIAKRQDRPISVDELARDLRNVGLEIPVYAVQQLLPRLATRGLIAWNSIAKAYFATESVEGAADTPDLPASFERLEELLGNHARRLKVEKPLVSETWADALIAFLKSNHGNYDIRAFNFKNVIIQNSAEHQEYVIATFLAHLAASDQEQFDHVIRVYTGIQIEDFIVNIQTLQRKSDFNNLLVYYDTAILLRILGTSGSLHQDATLEMHHSLQALGAKTYFLGSTGAEVENILGSITGAYERGHEIFNETSDALVNGEITIGQIKDFASTFESRLATLNIFPKDYDYATRRNEEYYQIEEEDFVVALQSAAIQADRGYSRQNAINDAKALAIVLRLRSGHSARDIGRSKVIFVTKNRLLQKAARRFSIEHTESFDDSSVPPMFTDGQITMAAWLGSGKAIPEAKISKELLAKCYSAVQPSPEWVDAFANALVEFQSENPDAVANRADEIIFLRAARMVARDESLNDAAVLKKLNIAEIFKQAQDLADTADKERERAASRVMEEHARRIQEVKSEHQSDLQRERQKAEAEFERVLNEKVQAARQEAEDQISELQDRRRRLTSAKVARFIVFSGWIVVSIAGSYFLLFNSKGEGLSDPVKVTLYVFLFSFTLGGLLDLGGVSVVKSVVNRFRDFVAAGVYELVCIFSDDA